MKRLWHRIRHGHALYPWAVYLWDEPAPPAEGCRTCIKQAVLRDIADQRRPWGKGF